MGTARGRELARRTIKGVTIKGSEILIFAKRILDNELGLEMADQDL